MSSIEVWSSMGYAARVILVILVAFASLLFFIVVERFIAYRRAERPAEKAPSPPRRQLQRRMHTLAAIKVTAPMIGLIGTLLGLINAFAGVAMSGGALDLRMVGAGIAEALVMTVLGLVIGLPAWWAHAFFAAWAERILAQQEGVRSAIG
ncbi:MAG: MotA/TolQ/ExbB proton channel family protein, partial [Planctomycetota bacterium]